MDLVDMAGYINGDVVGEDRRLLDTVDGTERDAWLRAMELGSVLRDHLRIDDLLVSVESKDRWTHYLYLEAERAA